MKLSRQDLIWNRATLKSGGSVRCAGDTALAALLLAHGLIMNGGVEHALECMSQSELLAALAGYRYFGLERAAQALGTPPIFLTPSLGVMMDSEVWDGKANVYAGVQA
jgi:hypothetical protein